MRDCLQRGGDSTDSQRRRPEIEEKGGRHFMVFYHFRLERIVEINVVRPA